MTKVLPLLTVVLILIVVLLLSTCSSPDPDSQGGAATPDPLNTSLPSTSAGGNVGTGIGIGDVESQMRVTITLSGRNESPNLRSKETQAKTEVISFVEVTATKPYPEKLFLFVNTESVANFPGHAVKAKVYIFVDDKKVDEFRFVYGRNAREEHNNYTIDLMEHLDETPTSVLVRAEADLVFYKDTDQDTIAIDSPEENATASAIKLSNPVRVNFY
jgi:hypothetical protein